MPAHGWQTVPERGVVSVTWPIFTFDTRNHIFGTAELWSESRVKSFLTSQIDDNDENKRLLEYILRRWARAQAAEQKMPRMSSNDVMLTRIIIIISIAADVYRRVNNTTGCVNSPAPCMHRPIYTVIQKTPPYSCDCIVSTMLTDCCNIWHTMYWVTLQHSSYWFDLSTSHTYQSCPWVHFVWPDPTQPISWLTQPNPTHYKWKTLDPTRLNPIQLTMEFTV